MTIAQKLLLLDDMIDSILHHATNDTLSYEAWSVMIAALAPLQALHFELIMRR